MLNESLGESFRTSGHLSKLMALWFIRRRKEEIKMDYNKVILLGRLTRDPEVKYLSSGTAFCSFGIATNRHYNAQNGERQQEVCFVDCKAFGRQAEIIGDYVVKGSPLLIDGRLSFYQYEVKNCLNYLNCLDCLNCGDLGRGF